ncbi:Non-motile and phage-resistance protein [bacterium HR09]|nr:Non-motile and phage-resistance protein [bacterium HR09]
MNNAGDTPTIMVVDDNAQNLTLLRELLEAEGYRVLAFPSGKMALAAARKNPPDLILLDIIMPEMNGFEVCQQLKAEETLQAIPVLFLSAMGETAHKVKAFAAGGVDYITKPFQMEEVLARVRAHLEIRRQRLQLEETYRQLRDLETLRDNLTQMIVHDMRSPLMIAGISLDMVRKALPGTDEAILNWWWKAKSAIQQLTAMCNGILDVSRLESGQMPLEPVPCDAAQVVSRALAAVQAEAQLAGLKVESDVQPLTVMADHELLFRVMVNLLSNAIRFTPKGGTIAARTEATPQGVRFEVQDTGRGIPPEHHGRIFEKFGQAHTRREGEPHSAGLGLAFCKLAVEAHGGTIGVDSEPGKGSCFWFLLPAVTTPSAVQGAGGEATG